jgi:hypothetical protein
MQKANPGVSTAFFPLPPWLPHRVVHEFVDNLEKIKNYR